MLLRNLIPQDRRHLTHIKHSMELITHYSSHRHLCTVMACLHTRQVHLHRDNLHFVPTANLVADLDPPFHPQLPDIHHLLIQLIHLITHSIRVIPKCRPSPSRRLRLASTDHP